MTPKTSGLVALGIAFSIAFISCTAHLWSVSDWRDVGIIRKTTQRPISFWKGAETIIETDSHIFIVPGYIYALPLRSRIEYGIDNGILDTNQFIRFIDSGKTYRLKD